MHLSSADGEDLPLPGFIDIPGLGQQALRNIYDRFADAGTSELVDPALFQLTNDALGHAVSVGVIQYGVPNPAFLAQLHKTGTWFAARKTYQQQQELAKLLVGKDGKTKRTWRDFKKAASGVLTQYNEQWLKTEYNTAVRAARMGSRWKEFEANSDLYPNLEYLPSRAATPRAEHKPFYHVIRPLNDSFWANHYPPSDYNCLCGAEPTDADVTPLPAESQTPEPTPGLDENTGQTGRVFSDTHPYTAQLKADGVDLIPIDLEGERLQQEADYALLRTKPEFMKSLNAVSGKTSQYPNATEEELASIYNYTLSIYYDLNSHLRGTLKNLKPDYYQYMDAMHRVLSTALQKMPKYTKTVFRGADMPQAIVDHFRESLKRGRPLQLKAFTSTSKTVGKAFDEQTRFVIKSKTGRNIVNTSHYGKAEEEVLFDAGTWFQVDKIEAADKGVTVIYMTEVKPPTVQASSD